MIMASTGDGTANAAPRGLSLHVGLNEISPAHYGGSNGRLEACINDAEEMEKLAAAQGFTVLGVLRDSQGTRQAVKDAFTQAANTLKSGDIFLFTYSGHGSFVPDENGDEPDKADETWCLFDGMLIDDEVNLMWQAFAPGVRIMVLLDCCHSGTAIRDFLALPVGGQAVKKPRARALPPSLAKKTWMTNHAMYKAISDATAAASPGAASGEPACTVTLISGCKDEQVSIDDWPNGVFTAHVLAAWDNGAFQGSIADFHAQIIAAMPFDQQPNLYTVGAANPGFAGQRPFTV
jgi:metacaspase-1